MSEVTTVAELLRQGDPNADAIGAPERRTMTRGELVALVDNVGGALRAIGIGPQDAVAIVMPNGPETATAFLAVASSATAAPRWRSGSMFEPRLRYARVTISSSAGGRVR